MSDKHEGEQMKVYTSAEVAEKLGVSDSRVRQLCIDKKIKAEKLGHVWMISEQAYRDFLSTRG